MLRNLGMYAFMALMLCESIKALKAFALARVMATAMQGSVKLK
jgi:hypothetical protein